MSRTCAIRIHVMLPELKGHSADWVSLSLSLSLTDVRNISEHVVLSSMTLIAAKWCCWPAAKYALLLGAGKTTN